MSSSIFQSKSLSEIFKIAVATMTSKRVKNIRGFVPTNKKSVAEKNQANVFKDLI